MTNLCFYFQVHQPFRLRNYSIFDIGNSVQYLDDQKNREICQKVAQKCYLPMNELLLELLYRYPGFKVAFSISGVALEQFERYAPEVLDSFKNLAETGRVEFLGETYYHSLSFLFDKREFEHQVGMHRAAIERLFGQTPKVFRNTELIFNNELAAYLQTMGYKAVLAEGADHILGWRSPNFVYSPKTAEGMKLLLKNYKLSDDIAFRFSNKGWEGWPLTASKFADWCAPVMGDTINLFMDYETFGEHQWEDTGIFDFMRHLPEEIFRRGLGFHLPSEAAQAPRKEVLDIHSPVSWADVERDLSAWLGNKMQDTAIARLYKMKDAIFSTHNSRLIETWRRLTTSDHFYYMCTKWFSDGDVHKYFNPYESPYECYLAFMTVLDDLALRSGAERSPFAVQETKWITV